MGLYLNPPDKAIVLSVDEESQIQALDPTQAIPRLRPGLPERQTHDYERHGGTTLFAALDVAAAKTIGKCQPLVLPRIRRSRPSSARTRSISWQRKRPGCAKQHVCIGRQYTEGNQPWTMQFGLQISYQ